MAETTEMKVYPTDYDRIEITEEFIKNNNFELKTDPEYLKKVLEDIDSFFGFATEVMIHYLPWEDTKEYYNDEYLKEVEAGTQEKPKQITSVTECAQDFVDYLQFAWTKAMDERGISASRSIEKLRVYALLLGREDLSNILDDDDLYNPYGAPALVKVTEELGLDVPEELEAFSKVKC